MMDAIHHSKPTSTDIVSPNIPKNTNTPQPHNPQFRKIPKVHTVLANGVPNSKLPKCYGALHQDPPLSCLKKSSKSDFTPQTPRPRPGPFLASHDEFPGDPPKKHVPKHAAPKTCRVLWVDFPVGGADAARRTEA